jgi:hypothetical protein
MLVFMNDTLVVGEEIAPKIHFAFLSFCPDSCGDVRG